MFIGVYRRLWTKCTIGVCMKIKVHKGQVYRNQVDYLAGRVNSLPESIKRNVNLADADFMEGNSKICID